jgi:hypothetical protein
VERTVREVMGSEGTRMMKATKWRKKAKAAISKGGSSKGTSPNSSLNIVWRSDRRFHRDRSDLCGLIAPQRLERVVEADIFL